MLTIVINLRFTQIRRNGPALTKKAAKPPFDCLYRYRHAYVVSLSSAQTISGESGKVISPPTPSAMPYGIPALSSAK